MDKEKFVYVVKVDYGSGSTFSPEYYYEGAFSTKEQAQTFIKKLKEKSRHFSAKILKIKWDI